MICMAEFALNDLNFIPTLWNFFSRFDGLSSGYQFKLFALIFTDSLDLNDMVEIHRWALVCVTRLCTKRRAAVSVLSILLKRLNPMPFCLALNRFVIWVTVDNQNRVSDRVRWNYLDEGLVWCHKIQLEENNKSSKNIFREYSLSYKLKLW